MAYYVYLLRCEDETLYGGIATDPFRRLNEHKEGTGAKYTRAHGAKYMEKIWVAEDRSTASKVEYAIKHLPKEEKESLIAGKSLLDVGIDYPCLECGTRDYPEKLRAAKEYFLKDKLLSADLSVSVDLGISVVVRAGKEGVLTYLPYSRFYQLLVEDERAAKEYIQSMKEPWEMIVVHHDYEKKAVADRYRTTPLENVYNVVYEKKTPPHLSSDATIRPLQKEDLPWLLNAYSLYDAKEEMIESIEKKELLGAYVGDKAVGFIGFHAEGTMGMLHVFPKYRNKGYGAALVAAQIALLLSKKRLPIGQIFLSNAPSVNLQKKLGFSFSAPTITWIERN